MIRGCDGTQEATVRFPYGRFAIVATLFFVAIGAAAQVREQITVEAVDVPVYVFHGGKPVRNLSKDDFELYVNGKRQPIDYFEAVDFVAPPSPPPAALPEKAPLPPRAELRDRRLFLFLFDLVYNQPAALDRGRHAALEMVNHAPPGDLFAVATVTSGNGIIFDVPFVRDRDAVRRAIVQLTPSRSSDALALTVTNAERETAEAYAPFFQGGGNGTPRAAGPMSEDLLPEILALALPELQARQVLLANDWVRLIGELAQRLRELEGDKHVIVFSQGFHIQVEHMSEQSRAVTELASAFQSANILLHAVDLTPTATGASLASMSAARGPAKIPASENQSLLWISAKTGGEWVHWKNAPGAALDELSSSHGMAYRLGFKPANARKDHNDIEVKVKNLPPGATVSFRKGFSGTVSSAAVPDALRLADIIQNDTPQSGTPPEVVVTGRRLDVIIPVQLLSRQFGAVAGAQVMLYVFDAKGVPILSREKTFSIPEHAEADRVIQQNLDLPQGHYVVKVLLRAGSSLAFVKEPFEISNP